MNILNLIGRQSALFDNEIERIENELNVIIEISSFLILGGAGSIGSAVVKEIFKRNPRKIHVIDISENNLVELVRDIRSSLGYIDGEFKTFALDIGSENYNAFINSDGKYDYVLNLSALKHVRSEKDPFTLMRMIDVNVFNTESTLLHSIDNKTKKYFCVSTDKAANPVNMMGASKKIMEYFLMRRSLEIPVSTARFANVAFSDGSLLHGFNKRIEKKQPISAPTDIRRYFLTPKESGELCLISALFGDNRDIFFPKLSEKLNLITFAEITEKYLHQLGYEPYKCENENEARKKMDSLPKLGKWPVYFFQTDTTGEKDFEEFFTQNELLDLDIFENIGIIKNEAVFNNEKIEYFINRIDQFKRNGRWKTEEIIELFNLLVPNFKHQEMNKNLDQRM